MVHDIMSISLEVQCPIFLIIRLYSVLICFHVERKEKKPFVTNVNFVLRGVLVIITQARDIRQMNCEDHVNKILGLCPVRSENV